VGLKGTSQLRLPVVSDGAMLTGHPKRYATAGLFAFVFVIFQHFQIVSVQGYPLTLGLFAGIVMILIVSPRNAFGPISIVWSVIVVLSAMGALASPEFSDGVSFARTLLLMLLSSAVIVSGFYSRPREFIRSPHFAKALFFALIVVVGLSVLQVLTGAMGSVALFNPFGANQYLYQYQPYLQYVAVPRAQGFYLEPSYDAFVVGTLTVCLLALGRYKIPAVALGFVGLLACQSATGLLLFVVVALVIGVRSNPRVGLSALALLAALLWFAGPSLFNRLSSIGTASSSANYRLVAPLEVMQNILSSGPFGYPLGSISDVMATYGLQNGTSAGSTLDNGFYVVIFYFGWAGLIALGAWLVATLRYVFRAAGDQSDLVRAVPLWLFSCMFFSGGIVLPEFAISLWLVISCLPQKNASNGEPYFGRHAPSQYRYRHIQRSGWLIGNSRVS
jgi:putative colanic acid polymerase